MCPRGGDAQGLQAWVWTPSRVRDLHVLIRTPGRDRDRDSCVSDRTPSRVWDRHVAIRTPASHGLALRSEGVQSYHMSH